jgi:AraC-like DNA-binding protein
VQVGVIGVRAMLAAFRRLGIDTRRVQEEAAIRDRDLADPDGLLPARALYRMWEVADGLWNRPALGLEAGSRVPLGAYEVLDYLFASAATLRDGMKDFAAAMALATRTAEYDVDEGNDLVRCRMRWRIPPQGVMFQLRDYSLAVVARRVRDAAGGVPLRVEIEGPPLTTAEHYRRVLGAPVALRAEANALVFTRERWMAPLSRADASLHRTLRRHAELLLERTPAAAAESLADRVRSELLRRIRVGVPTIAEVARALGFGSRTLQRQLRGEGVSFAALADQVRTSLAGEYLRDPGLSIAEVAYLLGFSEPSAFTRAFRRWTGRTPEEARRGARS